MKLKVMLVIAALALFAVSVGNAVADNGDKVTGGGQVIFSEGDVKASTIAFTAQGTTETAKGQIQFINRAEGAGQNQVKYHGVVDCLEVTDNYGVIGGHKRGDEENRFVLRVVDNGEPNRGADLIQFDNESEDNACGDDEEDEDPEFALAHGNAQVRDGDSGNPPEQQSQQASGLSFLGL